MNIEQLQRIMRKQEHVQTFRQTRCSNDPSNL